MASHANLDIFQTVYNNIHYMKYLEMKNKFEEKGLVLFSKEELKLLLNMTNNATKALLQRYKKRGYIKNPKRNMYFFSDNPPPLLELAYRMYQPSYVSFETALSTYGIIPEVVYVIVAATTKPTRTFNFEDTTFKYLKIKQQAFTGYIKKDNYFIAEPEKALVDYLYFVATEGKSLNKRLDLSQLNKKKVMEYVELFENRPLSNLIEKIYANH